MQENEQHEMFRRHWVRWQPRIYGYIRTIVYSRTDAEDLLQDVAEVLWQKIDQFEPGTRFEQWALAIARNKVLNFQKGQARKREKFSDSLEQLLADEGLREVENQGDLIAALESCVAKLSAPNRDLLSQRYQDGATNRSVARATQRSESAISRTLDKIYRQLMGCIGSATSEQPAQVGQ